MPDVVHYTQGESQVYRPGRWLALVVGTVILLSGSCGFLCFGSDLSGPPFWLLKLATAVFALMGGTLTIYAIGILVVPARITHASLALLPAVPNEPVITEGWVVHGRLTHELSEDSGGWQIRPAKSLLHNDKRFLFGFGIPFLLIFSTLLTWCLHTTMQFGNWAVSAMCALFVTAITAGTSFLLLGTLLRASYQRLARLTIPRDGNDLELDAPAEVVPEKVDLDGQLSWLFLGDVERQQLKIPRNLVVAVQLCPWKHALFEGKSKPWQTSRGRHRPNAS